MLGAMQGASAGPIHGDVTEISAMTANRLKEYRLWDFGKIIRR
jgi:hypothetical protein